MRLVVKVGTSTLTYSTGRINIRQVERLCKVLSDLKNAGHEVILVSSGAIAMGMGKLPSLGTGGYDPNREPDEDMPTKQAAAAVGQCELMYTYDKLFLEYSHVVAQVLITREDLDDPGRKGNFQRTLERLLELGTLPVINENNCVSFEEISVGDNDTLAANVATCVGSRLLVLLSDIDGLYDANPRENPNARLIHEVRQLKPEIYALAGEKGSALATGGMVTKLRAAGIVTARGVDMVIANGARPECLYDILDGKPAGTRFYGREEI